MEMFKYVGCYKRGENVNEFRYNIELSVSEKVRFVSTFTDLIINEEHLNLVARDLMFDYMLMVMFTDVRISDELKESSDSIAAIETFFAECDLLDQLKNVIDENLIKELNHAIDKDIEYKTGIRMNRLEDSLAGLMDEIQKKLGNFEVTDMVKELLSRTEPDKILDLYMRSSAFKKKQEAADRKHNSKFKVVE